MLAFSYDRTFEGLLCAVFDAYTQKRFPERLLGPDDSPSLLLSCIHKVARTEEKSGRVFRALTDRLSEQARQNMMLAWLSEEPGADECLFRFICKAFDSPRNIAHDLSDADALAVCRLAKKTRCEQHRLIGFARFQKTVENVYFAALRPRHNVLPLLLPHFADRFSDQAFIVYDCERSFGFHHDCGRLTEVFPDPAQVFALTRHGGRLDETFLDGQERLFQNLWKTYFSAAGISERANPKLHARCLPRRYWAYLTEKQR